MAELISNAEKAISRERRKLQLCSIRQKNGLQKTFLLAHVRHFQLYWFRRYDPICPWIKTPVTPELSQLQASNWRQKKAFSKTNLQVPSDLSGLPYFSSYRHFQWDLSGDLPSRFSESIIQKEQNTWISSARRWSHRAPVSWMWYPSMDFRNKVQLGQQ